MKNTVKTSRANYPIHEYGKKIRYIYPLVTHDPNMLKNKSRGNLLGKIKVSLPEGKYENSC